MVIQVPDIYALSTSHPRCNLLIHPDNFRAHKCAPASFNKGRTTKISKIIKHVNLSEPQCPDLQLEHNGTTLQRVEVKIREAR